MIRKISITILLALCLVGVSGSVVLAQSQTAQDPSNNKPTPGLVQCGRVDANGDTIGSNGGSSKVDSNSSSNGQSVPAAEGCGFSDLINMINTLINYLIFIALPLSAISFAYAGWLYITAVSKPDNLSTAKTIFTNVGIGLILVLSAWLIFKLIETTFLNTSGTEGYKTYLN